MKRWLALLLLAVPLAAPAQLEWLKTDTAVVFGGRPQSIPVLIRNQGSNAIRQQVGLRWYQLSSSTAMPVGEMKLWKELYLLPGQTVLEEARLALPEVRTETRFQLLWLGQNGLTLGSSEVWACAPTPLQALTDLGGSSQVGIYDPAGQLKPVFTLQQVPFTDLSVATNAATFRGRMVIINPPPKNNPLSHEWLRNFTAHAKEEGTTAIVWLQRPDNRRPPLAPQIEITRHGKATIVVARGELADTFARSALAQLNLVRCAEMALRDNPPEFAGLDVP